MITNIVKWGNSQGIRIPKSMLDELHWSENENILIIIDKGKLVIEKTKKKEDKKIIEALFKENDEKYEPVDIDWGEPEGDEIW